MISSDYCPFNVVSGAFIGAGTAIIVGSAITKLALPIITSTALKAVCTTFIACSYPAGPILILIGLAVLAIKHSPKVQDALADNAKAQQNLEKSTQECERAKEAAARAKQEGEQKLKEQQARHEKEAKEAAKKHRKEMEELDAKHAAAEAQRKIASAQFDAELAKRKAESEARIAARKAEIEAFKSSLLATTKESNQRQPTSNT